MRDPIRQFFDRHRVGNYRWILVHHGGYGDLLVYVRFVILVHMQSTPTQFFGHHRVAHKHQSNALSDHGDEHQREDGVIVPGDLKSKDDERKRCPSCRSEDRRHRNQRKRAR